jgi:AcrR family transcriptional regulator
MAAGTGAASPLDAALLPAVVPALPGGEGGPRRRRADRTRARLLDAARAVFGEVGWARARVEDVCRAAGVGHGTFYAYFPNKTAILEALVRRHAAALYALAEAPWTGGDVRADVRQVIAGFVDLSVNDRDIRATWAAAAGGEPGLAALFDEVRRQFVQRIRANLAAALAEGLARPELDVDVAATALAAMVEYAVLLAPPEQSGERLVAGLTDLWVAAVYR